MMAPLYRTQICRSEYGSEYKDYADNLINTIEECTDQTIVDEGIQAAKEIIADDFEYSQEVLEIRDYALLNIGVKLAKRKEIEQAVTLLSSVKNFDKMADAFQEISSHIKNSDHKEIVIAAAKNSFNQGSRPKMTFGEMRKLPSLLDRVLICLSSVQLDMDLT